jgi:hypothetical protein
MDFALQLLLEQSGPQFSHLYKEEDSFTKASRNGYKLFNGVVEI